MADNRTWDQEDKWWEQNFSSRPYAAGRTYDDFRPAYRYGFESGTAPHGPELERRRVRPSHRMGQVREPAGPADRRGRT